jgi:hypothetical protein
MSITSIPKNSNRVCLINHHDNPLKDHQKSVTQEIIFMAIKEARLYPSKTLDSIDSAIAFNQVRMNNASRNQALKARLVKRVNDLKSIKSIFKSHQNIEFIGLIGWGEGCIYSGIKCRQNISSVDGFLYKDKNGDTHYQRLGSCLEYFLDSGSKQSTKKYHGSLFDLPDIYTQNGKDINFNKQTVSDGNQMTNINQWFHISKETINSVCEVVIHKAAAINITDSFGTSFARKQGETLGLGLPAEKSVLTFKNKSQYRHEELKGSFNYNFNSDSDE